MDWLFENLKWIFSGIGAVVIAGFFKWSQAMKKVKSNKIPEKEPSQSLSQGDDIQINAAGDAVFVKDNGKAIQVKNSQVGVVGNNTKINGGIHFKNQK